MRSSLRTPLLHLCPLQSLHSILRFAICSNFIPFPFVRRLMAIFSFPTSSRPLSEDILQIPFLENSFTHFYLYPYKWNFRSPTLINISDLFPVLLFVNVLITVPPYHQKKSSNPCPRSDIVFPPFMFDSPVSFVILILIRTLSIRVAMQGGKEMTVKSGQQRMTKPYRSADVLYYHGGFHLILFSSSSCYFLR